MKRAKRRRFTTLIHRGCKPGYHLADLLAQMPGGKVEWTPELRAWDEMKPVGREFGADTAQCLAGIGSVLIRNGCI